LDLAEDPQATRTLSMTWDETPPPPAARDSLLWLGRLADIRLRQLAETSRLMYAENFYIVLYDPATDQIRFTYCVDIVDTDLPVLNQPMPLQEMEYSL